MDLDLHELALEAARAGAQAVRRVAGRLDTVQKTGAHDLVTAADHASERAVIEVIRAARPGDRIVAEETGEHGGLSGVHWLVDPVDGTANLVAARPDYAVCVSAHREEVVLAAAIYRPADDQWLATAPQGLAGTLVPLIAPPRVLGDLLVTFSRPHPAELRAQAMRLRELLLPVVWDERRIGSAACSLLYVATGVLDAYVSVALPPWDTAAGHELVRLAGGAVCAFETREGTAVSVAGSASAVERLLPLLSGQ